MALLSDNNLVSGFGRFLGMISGAAVLVVASYFVVTFEPPEPHVGHGGIVEAKGHGYDGRLDWIPMIAGAVLAVCGGLLGRPGLLVLGFLVSALWSYMSILYAFLVPWSPSSMIVSWGHIGYLVGAALLGLGRYRAGR